MESCQNSAALDKDLPNFIILFVAGRGLRLKHRRDRIKILDGQEVKSGYREYNLWKEK